MKMQVEQQKEAVDKLIGNTRLLEQKMAEAKSKKDTLKARGNFRCGCAPPHTASRLSAAATPARVRVVG